MAKLGIPCLEISSKFFPVITAQPPYQWITCISRAVQIVFACMCLVMSDSATPWTAACQAPVSMEFSRQEYWSGLPFPPPGDLPNPGIEPVSPTSPALAGRVFTTESLGKSATRHRRNLIKQGAFLSNKILSYLPKTKQRNTYKVTTDKVATTKTHLNN